MLIGPNRVLDQPKISRLARQSRQNSSQKQRNEVSFSLGRPVRGRWMSSRKLSEILLIILGPYCSPKRWPFQDQALTIEVFLPTEENHCHQRGKAQLVVLPITVQTHQQSHEHQHPNQLPLSGATALGSSLALPGFHPDKQM